MVTTSSILIPLLYIYLCIECCVQTIEYYNGNQTTIIQSPFGFKSSLSVDSSIVIPIALCSVGTEIMSLGCTCVCVLSVCVCVCVCVECVCH